VIGMMSDELISFEKEREATNGSGAKAMQVNIKWRRFIMLILFYWSCNESNDIA